MFGQKGANGWKNNSLFVMLALIVVGSLLISGCGGTKQKSGEAKKAPKTIKIGGTLPLSGPASGDGKRFMDGRQLAVETINKNGGINGAQLELIVRDDGFEPAKVTSLYETLARDDKVDVLLSSYGAPMTLPAMAVAEKYNKLVLSGYSSSTGLMEKYGGKSFFTIAAQPKNKAYVNWFYRSLTDFLWDFEQWNTRPGFPKPTKIAVLNENQLWGIEQHKLWKPHAEAQGWKIVVDESVEMDQMEFSSIISKIKSAKPDVILVEFFYFRSIPFIKQLREQNVKVNFVAMSEAGTSADWPTPDKGAGAVGNHVITFAYLPKTYKGGGSEQFKTDFKAKYGREPGFLEAAGYAEIQLLAEAIKKAGTTETEKLRNVLLNESFETCYTPVKFDRMGLNEKFNPIPGQWIDGQLENIYPAELKTHDPVYPFSS
ncbi:MAG: amino acid ABC transporter substrate-binding protein [Bacillota bacterium]